MKTRCFLAGLLSVSCCLLLCAQGGKGERIEGYDGIFRNPSYLLEPADILRYGPEQLPFLRNEVYASYGRPFVKEQFRKYFYAKEWYGERPNYSDSWLTDADKANIEMIKSFESTPEEEAARCSALAREGSFDINPYSDYAYDLGNTLIFDEATVSLSSEWENPYYFSGGAASYRLMGSWAIFDPMGPYGSSIYFLRFDFTRKVPILLEVVKTNLDAER